MKRRNRRILVIDDLPSIHDDYRKILGADCDSGSSLNQSETALFGELFPPEEVLGFQIDSAYQGQEGLGKVSAAVAEGAPYAMAFVDIRMPPGWDGIETIGHLWKADPALHVVICSAYSDYSWSDMLAKLGWSDRLLILKKPFDAVEVRQVAFAVTEKWNVARELQLHLANLEGLVHERTTELEQSLSLVQATLESTADGVLVVDPEGKVVSYNKKFVTMLQLPADLIETREDARLLEHVLDQCKEPEKFLERVKTIYAQPEGESFDLIEFKDGRVYERYSQPQRMSGRIVGRVWSFRDMTRRIQAEQALRESEQRFRLMADNAPMMVWLADGEGKCTYCNRTWTEFTGRSLKEELGDGWTQGIHPEDAETVLTSMQKCLAQRSTFQMEFRVRSAKGDDRWVFATAVPRFLPDGTFSGYIGSAVDLTERMNLEAQLRQAQKMESVGQLAGGVAHDFNNILTVIQGHASMLAAVEQIPAEFRESGRQIVLAAERAANLTAQLLTFGRRQVLQPRVVNLNEVVTSMTRLLQRVLGEHISLEIDRAARLPDVYADRNMLEQVLLNLAVNARDAMPRSGRLSITLDCMDSDTSYLERNPEALPGNHVCLTVADNGCGIPKDHLEKIFEPFFTTKTLGKGTGLGLATVYGIVKQHRGWIEVESQENKGATFRIYLPVSTRPASPEKPALQPAESRLPGGTETILVVEDETLVRRLVVNLLKRFGYTVHEAASGPEALVLSEKLNHRMDLLLTDVVMPDGMTGKDLAERLVAINPGLAVVYTSGYSADIISENFVLGGENFLQKPYEPRKLAQTIRHSLDAAAVVNRS